MSGDDGLPSWPTLISMMAACMGGLVILTARAFGRLKPRCEMCATNERVSPTRLCSPCFHSVRGAT